jgi:uncharacterized protein (DUF885 family)
MQATIDRLTDRYLQTIIEDYPAEATFLGFHSRDAELGAFTAEAFEEKAEHTRALLREFERVPPEGAPDDVAIDARVLRISLERSLRSHERLRPHERVPSVYIGTALSGCNQLILRDFAPLEERARSLLGRVRQIPGVLACCRRNIRDAPAAFLRIGADRARGGAAFLRNVVPDVSEGVPLLASDLNAAAGEAADAFDAIAEHLSGLEPDATSPFAVGREYYEWLLREVHLLDFDSDELLALGRRTIEETKAAMARVASGIDPDRDWREIVKELKADHPPADGLRERYAFEMERARRFVVERDLVTIPEGEKLDVIDTPVFARKLLPYAAYMPAGPFEARQQGFFWVTPIDASRPEADQERQLRGHGLRSIPVIALHEGYPGHHLQLVRANANTRKARKLSWNNVFIEGWALYCEEMMKDVGFLVDPATRLFQLKDMLWRAARVVVDVGLQRGEMSIDEAIDVLVDEASLERVNATAEVMRYTGNPTQPSSYLVGKLEIMEIRRRYEERLGADFDLKTFHDKLLDVGSVPPKLARVALGIDEGRPA